MNSLNVDGAQKIPVCPLVFQLNFVIPGRPIQNVENRVSLPEDVGGFGQDQSIRRDIFLRLQGLVQLVVVLKNLVAADGDGDGLTVGG